MGVQVSYFFFIKNINKKKMKILNNDQFFQWFVGFTEAEGYFKFKPRYRNGKIISFQFEFEIHLHIDDFELLNNIKEKLKIGNVYANNSRNSCNFVVGSEKELRLLINLFDGFPLNGVKLLDFLQFKEAFLLYFNREGTINEDLIKKLLKLKEGLNKGRVDFTMPQNHQINITGHWLVGLIDGEGSFSMTRGSRLRLCFQLLFTANQKPLLEAIKVFLMNNLGFDKYSLWKLENSSVIGIFEFKAKGNSKPTVCLEIRNVHLLQNYFILFLSNYTLLSKKSLDFSDFKILCQTMYKGGYKNSLIRELLIKLSLRMNDFRLSTFKGNLVPKLTNSEHTKLLSIPTELPLINDVVFLILAKNQEELLVKNLKEASEVVGVHYSKLSKLIEHTSSKEVVLNNFTVKRISVFCGSEPVVTE